MTARKKPIPIRPAPEPTALDRFEAMTDRERLALAERLELEILRPIMPWPRRPGADEA